MEDKSGYGHIAYVHSSVICIADYGPVCTALCISMSFNYIGSLEDSGCLDSWAVDSKRPWLSSGLS